AQGAGGRAFLLLQPALLALLGCRAGREAALLPGVAAAVGLAPAALAQATLPHALPPLMESGERQDLDALIAATGSSPKEVMLEQGHHVLASQLLRGSGAFDPLIALSEELTGMTFLEFLRAAMPRTLGEVIWRGGGLADWEARGVAAGPGGGGASTPAPPPTSGPCPSPSHPDAPPPAVVERVSRVVLELGRLAAHRRSEVPASATDFLAEGDHVTRTLKELGDRLDAALPGPSALEGVHARAGQTRGGGGRGGGSNSGGGSANFPVDTNVCTSPCPPRAGPDAPPASSRGEDAVTALRCVALLAELTGRHVTRWLPQLAALLAR
ncbi:hypothetical protein APUTEX25_000526, partial [Auxenochlorella protothecoides]